MLQNEDEGYESIRILDSDFKSFHKCADFKGRDELVFLGTVFKRVSCFSLTHFS